MNTPTMPKLGFVGPVQFLKEVRTELKKVDWPSRDETMKLTAVVIAVSVIVGIFIGGLDYLMIAITSMVFKK